MSGHSKWHSIKHKKGAADAKRGKLFSKLARAVTVAARDGGGDPDHNPTLATAIQKAKDASMPKDKIQKAIDVGTGAGSDGAAIERIVYEGYGPAGVAVLVEALTDNRNRASAEIRHAFSKHGGSLGEPGSVAWIFEKKGAIVVDGGRYGEDDLIGAIDRGTGAGADSAAIERIVYEGYGPAGVAILVEALTDNRNRAGAEIRFAFSKHGGSLGEPGSVAWIFEKKGAIVVDGSRYGEDDVIVAIDAGAEDVREDGDQLRVICEPGDLVAVREALEGAGVEVVSAGIAMEPKTTVELKGHDAERLLKLLDALDEQDDVDEVFANFDIPEDVLEKLAA